MSNEVNKEAEENAEKQDSVEQQQTNTNNSSETKTEEAGSSAQTQTDENTTEEDQTFEPDSSGEMDFGAILEQFEQEHVSFHSGQMVNGKVIGISDRGVLVDFGYKSEGIVPVEEFTDDAGELTIKEGDKIDVIIKQMGPGDAPPILSRDDAQRRYSWDKIEEAFKSETPIKGIVKDKTKGGLKVDIDGVEAFLPGSQVDSQPVRNLDSLKGQEIEAQVIKFSRKRNNIVISRKVLTDLVYNEQKKETLNSIGEKHIVEGTVKNLTDYGAFIDIGGIDGLLHVTDMSWGRLQNPNELFKVGDHVQVKILKLDREKEKISLGFKQLTPDPWTTVTELYPVNTTVNGEVSSVTEYGAFIELEPGVEGLVHISEMSWSKRLKHPRHIVKNGEEVEVQVLGIDPDERRISLGIKQLQENPWDTIGDRYFIGSKVKGKVRNLTDFGAFVEIEEGVDGLVHISDIAWSKKIKHPKEVLSKGQEVEAIITSIDTSEHRLSLSIKELTPSSWETFTNEHKAGDVVKGKVSRFAGFGVFVELAPDLEGLCHISELSDERIENPEDKFEIGQELDFKILRIEPDVEKIGLSHRAVGQAVEKSADSSGGKSYSSQAKGGMASLGELAKLKFGKQPEEAAEEAKAESTEEKAEELKAEVVETEETSEQTAETETAESEETKTETTQPKAEATADSESAEDEEADISAVTADVENSESVETENKTEISAESKDEKVVAKDDSETEEISNEESDVTSVEANAETEVKSETSKETKAAKTQTKEVKESKTETSEDKDSGKAKASDAETSASEKENTKEKVEDEEVKAETAEVKEKADKDETAETDVEEIKAETEEVKKEKTKEKKAKS
ncbi:MAG: 30S ribosomal protein S1 [Acidobacteriota bacterium]|jgi:small subunit ribosomal protein S1|nr:30S ribosomal protein S1 [Acidobacteriota bacterium]